MGRATRYHHYQVETGYVTTATTTGEGVYTVTNLRPVLYTIAVTAPSFRRLVREGLRLATGERIRVDVALSAGKLEEQVTVKADASLLRTVVAL